MRISTTTQWLTNSVCCENVTSVGAEQGNNQSVERAAAVLRAFSAGRPELRLSDVARLSGLGLSTASRLLGTLEALEFVERDEVSGLYRLGPGVLALAGAAVNEHPVHRAGRQVAQQLAHESGLGANLAVRRGGAVFYLCNFEGGLAPKSYTMMGQSNPLHATGLGKCLLTGLDPATRRSLLPDPLPAYTGRTLTSPDGLDAELDLVLRRGYATEIEELALGRACVAAPIRDGAGETVGALSVSGPLSAIDLESREAELGRLVIEAADQISVALGYLSPAHHNVSKGAAVKARGGRR
jgi:DNA-binding IclR family transcriptional regulator